MEPATVSAVPEEVEIRMGSEYASARDYLARMPRTPSGKAATPRKRAEPQHGSNDSDFGLPDQRAE